MADGFALLYPSDAEGSDNDFVVKRGSNCYKTCGFPCYSKLPRVLSEEVQNLRHVSIWRNDRTSHVLSRRKLVRVQRYYSDHQDKSSSRFFRSFSLILRSSSLNSEV